MSRAFVKEQDVDYLEMPERPGQLGAGTPKYRHRLNAQFRGALWSRGLSLYRVFV